LQRVVVDKIVEVRCNLDDITPEVLGYTMERLLAAGAADVWHMPIQMKKNRPAVMLSLLCRPEQLDNLAAILMAETGTLGLRFQEMERLEAGRNFEERDTEWGTVRFKLTASGEKAEYEDCRKIAIETGLPLRVVQKKVSQ
jgi:uncharacterized protein (DUF111 family)